MKKFLKSVSLFITASFLAVSVFACSGNTPADKKSGKDKAADISGKIQLDANKWRGETLTYAFSWQSNDPEDEVNTDPASKAGMTGRKVFEDATGTKLTNIHFPAGEDYFAKVVTQVSAGMGPDIVYLESNHKPAWMLNKIIVPLSDYIDFNKPYYNDNSRIGNYVKDYYTWGGKIYAMNGVQPSTRLYYNKEKFTNAGLEDPLELWKQGKWNWEKFFELGQAITQDTDGDGVMDQWGHISWWANEGFIHSNDVEYIKYDENGMPRFALDEKYVNAMQAFDDAVSKYKITPAVWWDPNPQERLYSGESAMDYWGYWDMQTMRDNLGDKLGIVPFPNGPDLDPNIPCRDKAQTTAFAITSTSRNPDLAAAFLEWHFEPNPDKSVAEKRNENNYKLYGSKEMFDIAMSWTETSVEITYTGYGQGFQDALNLITSKPMEKSWQQAIEENKAACQAAIDAFIVDNASR